MLLDSPTHGPLEHRSAYRVSALAEATPAAQAVLRLRFRSLGSLGEGPHPLGQRRIGALIGAPVACLVATNGSGRLSLQERTGCGDGPSGSQANRAGRSPRLCLAHWITFPSKKSSVDLVIHRRGGVHTSLRVARRRRGRSCIHTSSDVVDAIFVLSHVRGDEAFLDANGASAPCDRIPLALDPRAIRVRFEGRS